MGDGDDHELPFRTKGGSVPNATRLGFYGVFRARRFSLIFRSRCSITRLFKDEGASFCVRHVLGVVVNQATSKLSRVANERFRVLALGNDVGLLQNGVTSARNFEVRPCTRKVVANSRSVRHSCP